MAIQIFVAIKVTKLILAFRVSISVTITFIKALFPRKTACDYILLIFFFSSSLITHLHFLCPKYFSTGLHINVSWFRKYDPFFKMQIFPPSLKITILKQYKKEIVFFITRETKVMLLPLETISAPMCRVLWEVLLFLYIQWNWEE